MFNISKNSLYNSLDCEKVNLNFTKSIDLTIKEIERFIEQCKVILFLEQESIHVKLDNLYLSIAGVQQSQKEELHPLQLAWAAVVFFYYFRTSRLSGKPFLTSNPSWTLISKSSFLRNMSLPTDSTSQSMNSSRK